MTNWILDTKRREIIKHPAKRKVLVAGRRFGKSYLSLMWLLSRKIEPNERRWIITPTYRQGKTTTWKLLRTIFRDYDAQVNESELLVKLPNGAEIAIKGSEQENNLRGAGIDMVCLEEYSYIKPHVWEEIIYPMLTTTDGDALFIGTPNGYDHLYDAYMLGQGKSIDWKSWQFTTIDGGYVPEKEIEKAKSMMDERTFKTEFLASFETTGNRAAYNFNRQIHVKQTDQRTNRLAWRIDFNVDFMSSCLIMIFGDSIHYLDEIRLTNSNTEEMAKEMRKIAPNIPVYPDAAGSARSTSSNRSDHGILKEFSFQIVTKKANPPIIDRLNALNRMLKDANGRIRMTVDPKCVYLIKDLEQVQRTRDGKIDKSSDIKLTHMLDACSYYIAYNHPIVKREAVIKSW